MQSHRYSARLGLTTAGSIRSRCRLSEDTRAQLPGVTELLKHRGLTSASSAQPPFWLRADHLFVSTLTAVFADCEADPDAQSIGKHQIAKNGSEPARIAWVMPRGL